MSSLEASVMLSRFAQSKKGYNVIWIDLEEHHTVAGVVTEIIDRMRVFDPDLSPLIQPVEKAEQIGPSEALQNQDPPLGFQEANDARNEFDKPVRFLHRALRRGRYIISFDSLEDFGREHTSHHGLPSAFEKQDIEDQNRKARLIRRVEDLLNFILRLIEGGRSGDESDTERVWDLDWYCGVACSMPEPRHDPIDDADKSEGVVQPVVEAIRRFFNVLEKDSNRKGSVVGRVPAKRSDISEMSLVGTKIAIIPIHPSEPPRSDNPVKPLWAQFEAIEENNISGTSHESNGTYRSIQTLITEHIGEFTRRVLSHRFGVSERNAKDLPAHEHWLMIGSPETNLLPILTLAAARRPRSFVGIRNLWCEYLPPDWKMTRAKKTKCVSAKLDFLEEQRLIRLMPGGFYWMPHRLHRKAYRLLTEPIRKRRINKLRQHLRQIDETPADAQQITETVVASALRLLFVVTIHSRLARFYYLHVFQRTRDANAMFEYLYHRVTSLKYLNLLLALLHDSAKCTPQIGGEIIARIRKSSDLLVFIEGQSSKVERDAVYPKVDGTEDVWGGLDRLRERLLQAFSNVFEREQEVFLSLGSADTWLAWIEQIKDHDLKDLVGFSESEFVAKSVGSSDAPKTLATEQVPVEQRARRMARLRDRLKGRLEDLHATLLREKRDWKECVRNRLKHLMAWMRRIAYLLDPSVEIIASKSKIPPIDDLSEPLSLAQYLFRFGHQKDEEFLRDLLELVRKTAVLGASEELGSITAEIFRLLNAGEPSLSTWSASDLVEELNRFFGCLEDVARCIHHDRRMSLNGVDLRRLVAPENLFTFAELMLTCIRSVASTAKAESGTQSPSLDAFSRGVRDIVACLDAWEVRIKFERIRLRFERHDLWSRRPTQHVIGEMKRFCSDLEEARHRTRGADTTNPIEFPLRRCQLRTLQASILTFLGRCREARLALAHAETGLTEETLQQRFQLAIVGEFKAQTWMKQADQVLDWFELHKLPLNSTLRKNLWFDPEIWESWEQHLTTRNAAWKAVRGNLEDASQVLLTAERLLQSGRRSTGQWLRLYGAKAQLEIENLLLMLFRMDGEEKLSSFGSELHFRAQLNNIVWRQLVFPVGDN